MRHFHRLQGRLHVEQAPLDEIAERYGTPCYVYSRAALEQNWHAFDDAFGARPHLICYAVKAASNIAILNLLARLGSGFDIVSVGELERVLAAGGEAGKTVFSGVAKRADEIARALEVGIHCFNVESEAELARINDIALGTGRRAPVSVRVNPDIDGGTHPYITTGRKDNKFGIDLDQAAATCRRARDLPGLELIGLDCHIGSQIPALPPFVDAVKRLLGLARELEGEGIVLRHLNLGGGLSIAYRAEVPPSPRQYVAALLQALGDADYEIIVEPGRAVVGAAGALLTRVEYLKRGKARNFCLVDAGMNDLLRPALYRAWQAIERVDAAVESRADETASWDIAGPVCESGDFLGRARRMALREGAVLCVRDVGAYGFCMASQYNSRPRAPEILVDGGETHVIRERESIAALFRDERLVA